MKTLVIILMSLFTVELDAQQAMGRSAETRQLNEFYTSGCMGDTLRVSMYSTDGSLLSTLMVPDDSELAIFSDSSRTTPELTEFRGTIKIRSKPVKRGDTTPHRQRPSDFDGAPIQIDLTDTDVSFVIVRHYDCSKVTE